MIGILRRLPFRLGHHLTHLSLRISPGLLPQAICTALCHQQFLSTIRGGLLSYLIHFFFGP